jgi:hypothetical protein
MKVACVAASVVILAHQTVGFVIWFKGALLYSIVFTYCFEIYCSIMI